MISALSQKARIFLSGKIKNGDFFLANFQARLYYATKNFLMMNFLRGGERRGE
jgi:hypothetical protein